MFAELQIESLILVIYGLAAEIGRHKSSRTFGSSFLFSAPSFLAAVFLTLPSSSLSPSPGASSRRLCNCTLFHPRLCPRFPLQEINETAIPAFKHSGVLLSMGPTQILRNYFPIWLYRAAKGSALVATPVSSLCQSSVFFSHQMSVRYTIPKHEWKPYLT